MHMDDLAVKYRGKSNTKTTVYILWKECIKCLFSLGMVSSLA